MSSHVFILTRLTHGVFGLGFALIKIVHMDADTLKFKVIENDDPSGDPSEPGTLTPPIFHHQPFNVEKSVLVIDSTH